MPSIVYLWILLAVYVLIYLCARIGTWMCVCVCAWSDLFSKLEISAKNG